MLLIFCINLTNTSSVATLFMENSKFQTTIDRCMYHF